ncbi:hypothetical protein ACEQ8H_007380 [Pleosporales sp. CAS-2024a]
MPLAMLRGQLVPRPVSRSPRAPYAHMAHVAAQDGHGSVTIHRFRVGRPWARRCRIVGTLALGAVCWGLSRYVAGHVDGTSGATHDGATDGLLFLPTGFSRPRPRTFYRGSDPEWQEFRKIATDRPRVDRIRNELTTMMRLVMQKDQSVAPRLGKIDPTKGRQWLEIKFPDGPPVEYERPGVELTKDLEWRRATRPVTDLHHQRLTKLLLPTDMSKVLYHDVKRKAAASWSRFTSILGLGDQPASDTVQTVVQGILVSPPTSPSPGLSTTPSPTTPAPAVNRTGPADSAASPLGFALPSHKDLTVEVGQLCQEFKKSSRPYPLQPPRGTFLVLGLIEVYGERARMTFNVTATYDPKQGRYVYMKISVWNLVDHSQRPRGGP